MKPAWVARLRCPISGGQLRLHSFQTDMVEIDGQPTSVTKDGILLSDTAHVWYPVSNYVPVLLVFKTSFHEWFHRSYKDELERFGDFSMPALACEPGEMFIQQSFTEEWNLTQDNELSFVRTHDDLVNLNRHVWLGWVEQDRRFDSVLNVGCGIGKETMALREVVRSNEILAVDLNFALLQAGERHRQVGNVQFVICSLFHLPFERESFDLVYSQGVLHHTWSTHAAFRSIASFVKTGGYLFIWVYGLDDHLTMKNSAGRSRKAMARHVAQRLLYQMEWMIRPWLSRSPSVVRQTVIFVLAAALHPLMRSRVLHKDLWKPVNTRHSLRDLLTPAFAFRHNTNEVVEWYEDLDFRIVSVQSPRAHKQQFSGKRIHGIGLTGQRMAGSA